MRPRLHERIEVIYEDQDLVLIEKSAGILSYPVRDDPSESAIQLIRRYWKARGTKHRHLYLVHRLDKATSGLLIFAKSSLARESLQKQFERHSVVREYVAITDGIPEKPKGEIRTLLGRDLQYKRAVAPLGKLSLTEYHVLRQNGKTGRALIRVRIHTGRTHQVRIHLAHIGAPIAGDAVYGKASAKRLALHADTLGFKHPRNEMLIVFRSSLPPDLRSMLQDSPQRH